MKKVSRTFPAVHVTFASSPIMIHSRFFSRSRRRAPLLPKRVTFFSLVARVLKERNPVPKKLFKCPTCKTYWKGKCPTPGAFFYRLNGQDRFIISIVFGGTTSCCYTRSLSDFTAGQHALVTAGTFWTGFPRATVLGSILFRCKLCTYQFVTLTSPPPGNPQGNPQSNPPGICIFRFLAPSSKKLFKCPRCKTHWMGKFPTPGPFFFRRLTEQDRFKTIRYKYRLFQIKIG